MADCDPENVTIARSRIQQALERQKPRLWAEGGDVELIEADGCTATVKLLGHCSGPPELARRVRACLEAAIREEVPDFRRLTAITPWD